MAVRVLREGIRTLNCGFSEGSANMTTVISVTVAPHLVWPVTTTLLAEEIREVYYLQEGQRCTE